MDCVKPDELVDHVQQFNEARAELSSKFSARVSGVRGGHVALVSQTVKTVGGKSTLELPLVFLPPGTSARGSKGTGTQGRWTDRQMNNAFHDAEEAEAADAKANFSGGRTRTGRSVILTSPDHALSKLSGQEPTEMAAAVTVRGIFREYDLMVTVPYYPLVTKTVQLTQCQPQPVSGTNWNPEPVCGPWYGTTVTRNGCGTTTSTQAYTCKVGVNHGASTTSTQEGVKGYIRCDEPSKCGGFCCDAEIYSPIYTVVTTTTPRDNCCGGILATLQSVQEIETSRVYRGQGFAGCFTPTTKIRMADGSSREISGLRSGDRVWNPVRRRAMEIAVMIAGPEEKPLIEIEAGGRSVRVTDGHPMLVLGRVNATSGFGGPLGGEGKPLARKAQDVSVGDLMLGVDGDYHPVTAVRILPIEVGQQVWNVRLNTESQQLEDHVIEADGVPTGDLAVQGWIGKSRG